VRAAKADAEGLERRDAGKMTGMWLSIEAVESML
jgi:hypothetical protein